jgi:hypothetical protein
LEQAGAAAASSGGSLPPSLLNAEGGTTIPAATGSAALAGTPTIEETPSTLSQIGSTIGDAATSTPGKLALAGLPLAFTLARGQPTVPDQIGPLTNSGSVTGPLISTEQTQLNEANTGQLTPGQTAQVALYQQQAQSALLTQLAQEGVQNPQQDSRYVQGMAAIGQQVQAMTQNYITAALQAGTAAAGDAASALTTAANAELATDQDFQSALNSAFTSFGLIAGLSKLAA